MIAWKTLLNFLHHCQIAVPYLSLWKEKRLINIYITYTKIEN